MMKIFEYIDRISVIHLPDRIDRYIPLKNELQLIGIDIDHAKVQIPQPPRPNDRHGFPSAGVYGNFLSHLGIISDAMSDGLNTVMILEDDAIFRSCLRSAKYQERLCQQLVNLEWDLCFLGHSLTPLDLRDYPKGLVRHAAPFRWAHCYCVHRNCMKHLVNWLAETIERPVGDPLGGKMYIDGAFSVYRQLYPEKQVFVSNPVLSLQRSSPSGLGGTKWLDKVIFMRPLVGMARKAKDAIWRRTGLLAQVVR